MKRMMLLLAFCGMLTAAMADWTYGSARFFGNQPSSCLNLQKLLGYSKWDKFQNVIEKAKAACVNAGEKPEDHFPQVEKMVEIGSGAFRPLFDILLTRYASYLIAQNGDANKPEIAFAQNYFAVQTRRAELVEQRLLDYERVQARAKLAETEKILSGVLYERGVDSKGFAVIRSKGDKALFKLDTLPPAEDVKKVERRLSNDDKSQISKK